MHLCPIDKGGINTAYHACYLPSITYSLPATSFVEEDLHDIQNEATATFLSRLGFNCHCPTEIVYAPRWFGGIGLRHLYCEQGIMKVKRLLAHLRSKSSLGKVLNIIIGWYQQLSGLPNPILLNTSYIPGTRNQWLTSLQIFLHETNCTIRLEHEWSHPIIREHDQHIMSLLLDDDLPYATIETLNTVRQYLQITTIAELFDNSGLHFHAGAFGELTSDNQLVI